MISNKPTTVNSKLVAYSGDAHYNADKIFYFNKNEMAKMVIRRNSPKTTKMNQITFPTS